MHEWHAIARGFVDFCLGCRTVHWRMSAAKKLLGLGHWVSITLSAVCGNMTKREIFSHSPPQTQVLQFLTICSQSTPFWQAIVAQKSISLHKLHSFAHLLDCKRIGSGPTSASVPSISRETEIPYKTVLNGEVMCQYIQLGGRPRILSKHVCRSVFQRDIDLMVQVGSFHWQLDCRQ